MCISQSFCRRNSWCDLDRRPLPRSVTYDLWLMQNVIQMTYDIALCHPDDIKTLKWLFAILAHSHAETPNTQAHLLTHTCKSHLWSL